jgi:hypothetical protein
MAAAVLVAVILIYAAQYASWNPPGSRDPILGVEGRYFLPLLPLAALAFPPLLARSPRILVVALAGTLAALCAGICLWAVVFRYYVPSPPYSASERPARLTSFSVRALVGANENMLITGFAVGGHGMETLSIRAEVPGTGNSGILAHPALRVLDSEGTVLAATARSADASGLPRNSANEALNLTLLEGMYTVELRGTGGAAGMVREDIREISADGTRLRNVSARGFVGRGAKMMIVGFVVGGTGAEPVLGRAVGPGLRRFGVTAALDNPTLEMGPFDHGPLISTAWGDSPEKAGIVAASASAGAFPLSTHSADSAAIASLSPGSYTMKVYGADATTGIALAEVYEVP